MKKLITVLLLGTMFLGCKKKEINTTTASTLPVFKYEVILGTTALKGTYIITWSDANGSNHVDTSITSSWTNTVTPANQSITSMYVDIYMYNPGGKYVSIGTNVTNTITVNIYKNGVLDTSNSSTELFCDPNGGTACGGSTKKKIYHIGSW